jgi:hypothetical protein
MSLGRPGKTDASDDAKPEDQPKNALRTERRGSRQSRKMQRFADLSLSVRQYGKGEILL